MKANVELPLRTREVYHLFERKINGDKLFIEGVLCKFNVIMHHCQKQQPPALETYKQMEQQMQRITQQFTDETKKFESLLAKKKNFDASKVNFMVQFYPTITVTNPLAIQLVEFLQAYDRLAALLKLLHIAGFFDTDRVYFENVKRIQKIANQLLSNLYLTKKTPV